MNNKRRKQLQQAIKMLRDAQEIVDDVCNEEGDALLNLPDNLQSSERADTMTDNCDSLQEASNSIDDAISSIENID